MPPAATEMRLAAEAPPAPRDPNVLMKPERLAALQPSRLSLTRTFMRKAVNERWNFTRLSFDIDARSVGTAHYRLDANGTIIDFPLTSFEYKGEGRTGRIIGRAWDMMGGLIDGATSVEEANLMRAELPKLYEGRATSNTLTWARANRSSRAFNHTIEALAAGRQPDIATLAEVCYLMRNTGIDGNGTFGTRSYKALPATHPLRQSLSAQMASAYMMRIFAVDLVNHLAKARSRDAVALAPEYQRFLGIGNGSALGLIFFLQNHPKLIDRWLSAREQAIVAAKSLRLDRGSPILAHLIVLLEKAIVFRSEDRMVYEKFAPSNQIAAELGTVRDMVRTLHVSGKVDGERRIYPLAAIADILEDKIHRETHETLLALYIELVPELADRLADDAFSVDEELCVQPEMSTGFLRDILHEEYKWALAMDLTTPESQRYIWYKSATAEEPRRGPRDEVENAYQLGLDLPRYVQELERDLAALPATTSVARFLMSHPRYRMVVARIQGLRGLRYHSPQMNIMADDFIPIHIVRLLNVAIHGVDRARDYLGRNLRGVLFLGAPTPDDIRAGTSHDWFNPSEPK